MSQDNEHDAADDLSKTRIEPDLVYATRLPDRETDQPPEVPADQYVTRVIAADTTRVPMPAQPDWPAVDGYEIIGELGRGGMGVVYKARQVHLNRLVALKMIRTGPSASPEEIRRFHIEAETIAHLQHPNIVQLFEVREQKGEAFLALELIEGSSLAKSIASPWPAQQAARLLETLARAMHYAHEQGIIHRDLKPANILLNRVRGDVVSGGVVSTVHTGGPTLPRKDGATVHRLPFLARHYDNTQQVTLTSYQPKITDFGLAKLMSADSAGPTVTGDFLGTPAYSAPEQASGKIQDIGPHTDVYSLGVILYELLTGRPPFQGATVLDTLEQVRSQEPVPPSRLQRRVPRDLETMCLKCLEKTPQRRYARAILLAEDLESYLAGRPIKARPVSAIERTLKWARRRPAQAALYGVILFAVAAFAGAGWWFGVERSAAAQREGKLRLEAEANFDQAVDAVESMLNEVGAVDLADVPQLEGVRKDLLMRAQRFYETFLRKRSDSPELRFLAGRAQGRLGDIHEMLDEYQPAEQAYLEARDLLELPSPDALRQHAELARVCNNLGVLFKRLGRYLEAEKSVRRAIDLRRDVLAKSPEASERSEALAESCYHLATILVKLPKQRDRAAEAYREALQIQEGLCAAKPDQIAFQRSRARTLNNLGILLTEHKTKEAEAAFGKAVTIYETVLKKQPTTARYRLELARSYNNLARAARETGKFRQAEETYAKSLKLLRQLALDFPTVPIYREELAALHFNAGLLFQKTASFEKSDREFREALRFRQQLADEYPGLPDYQDSLANVCADVGQALERRGHLPQADEHYVRAIALLEKIVSQGQPAYQSDLALALDYRGVLFLKRSRSLSVLQPIQVVLQSATGMPWYPITLQLRQEFLMEARIHLARAVPIQRLAWEADKQNAGYRKKLYNHYQNLCIVQRTLQDHEGLAASGQAFPEIYPQVSSSYVLAAKCLCWAATAVALDTRLGEPQRHETAERHADNAIKMLRRGLDLGLSKKDLQELRRSSTYEPLRLRPEFRRLIADVEDNTPRNA